MTSKNNSQTFSTKYVNTLKKAMVCCDKKQYKDGIKLCKKILEVYPKHGETLTVMGLLLYLKGTKDEGIQKAKLGLGYDLKNANSWRIYGMLMQEIKEYEKAVSSLRSSLKMDPNQFHLLRDMSRIQVQIRDFIGCKETRLILLKMKPNLRNCWLGYAVACDLSFDLETAIRVMHEFRKAQSEQTMSSQNIDVEYSQIIVYHIELLLRSPSVVPHVILTTLSSCERLISDKLFVLETKAKLYQLVGSMEESFKCLYELAQRNCEEPRYFNQMVEVLKIDEIWPKKVSFFHRMLQIFPSSETLQILILESSNDETFRTEFRSFFDRKLIKSVPNIFSLTRSLYSESFKIPLIEQVVLDCLKQPENSDSHLNGNISNQDCSRKSKINYYLAQHYNKLNYVHKSMVSINECLSSSPTFIDAILFKCSILKRVGLTSEASALASDACKLNKTDRYLNSMCSLYYLGNGQESESEAIQKSYSKELTMETHLKDLQVVWYIVELARMHFTKSDLVSSMKYANLVYKIFNDFSEDLLDFHGYSLRKCTLSPYIELMNYSILTFRHKNFFSIAKIAIKIYLSCHKSMFGIYSLSTTSSKQTFAKDSFSQIHKIVQKLVHFNPDDFESRELALLFYSATQNHLLMLRELLAMWRLQPESLSSTFALVNFLHSAIEKVIGMEDHRIVSVCETLWEKCMRGVSMKSIKSTSHDIVTLVDERIAKCGTEVCDFRGFLNLLLAKRYFTNNGVKTQISVHDLKSLLETISNEKYNDLFIENLPELENIVLLMQKNNFLSTESSEAFAQSLQKIKVLRQSTIS